MGTVGMDARLAADRLSLAGHWAIRRRPTARWPAYAPVLGVFGVSLATAWCAGALSLIAFMADIARSPIAWAASLLGGGADHCRDVDRWDSRCRK